MGVAGVGGPGIDLDDFVLTFIGKHLLGRPRIRWDNISIHFVMRMGSCKKPDFGINGVGPSVCSATVFVNVTTAYIFIAKINTY
jgi:hypothetical protein